MPLKNAIIIEIICAKFHLLCRTVLCEISSAMLNCYTQWQLYLTSCSLYYWFQWLFAIYWYIHFILWILFE